MNRISPSLCTLAVTMMMTVFSQWAPAQTLWNGGTGQNWSTAANWSPATIPAAATAVIFTNSGAASSAGAVDNIVDANFNIASLQFANTNNTGTGVGFFHTTQIGAGQSLAV